MWSMVQHCIYHVKVKVAFYSLPSGQCLSADCTITPWSLGHITHSPSFHTLSTFTCPPGGLLWSQQQCTPRTHIDTHYSLCPTRYPLQLGGLVWLRPKWESNPCPWRNLDGANHSHHYTILPHFGVGVPLIILESYLNQSPYQVGHFPTVPLPYINVKFGRKARHLQKILHS